MTDANPGLTVNEVAPGSADDPFAPPSDPNAAPSPSPAGGTGEAAPTDPESSRDGTATATSTDPAGQADPGNEGDDEDSAQLAQLIDLIRTEVRGEELPKVQSSYDRRIAALERQHQAALEAAEAQAKALQEELRSVKLSGLSAEDQQKLREQWAYDDRRAELESLAADVEEYHKSVFVADVMIQFPELELTEDELNQFGSPEEIEAYVKDTLIDFYRSQALSGSGAEQGTQPNRTATAAHSAAPDPRPAPAGVNAPSDAGGGAAVPNGPRFNETPGLDAMRQNISNGGWDTLRIGQ